MANNDICYGIVIGGSEAENKLHVYTLFNGFEEQVLQLSKEQFQLSDDINLADIVNFKRIGGPICKAQNSNLRFFPRAEYDEFQHQIRLTVHFMPLAYSLFPDTAKKKNLVLAMTDEIGYVPIVRGNTLKKHTFYESEAVLNFAPKSMHEKIAKTYNTPWLLFPTDEDTRASHLAYIEDKYKFCTGIVVDESLKDAFFVYSSETGLVSLRKEIAPPSLRLGSWLRFAYADVREAEKSNESELIFPTDESNVDFFDRRIALSPQKLSSPYIPYETGINDHGQIQLIVQIKAALNPTHKDVYRCEHIGAIVDENGHIMTKHENSRLRVKVRCKFESTTGQVSFSIEEVLEQQKIGLSDPGTCGGSTTPQQIQTQTESSSSSHRQKRPANSFEKDAVVVKVDERQHCAYCFANDPTLDDHIVRLDLNDMNPLPRLGTWVRLCFAQERRLRRPELRLWSAERIAAVYETKLAKNANEPKFVMLRVPLIIKGDQLYNKDLETVNDSHRRLTLRPESGQFGSFASMVMAWVQKRTPSPGSRHHWEIAPDPKAELVETNGAGASLSPKTDVAVKFKPAAYVGHRYEKTGNAVAAPVPIKTPKPQVISSDSEEARGEAPVPLVVSRLTQDVVIPTRARSLTPPVSPPPFLRRLLINDNSCRSTKNEGELVQQTGAVNIGGKTDAEKGDAFWGTRSSSPEPLPKLTYVTPSPSPPNVCTMPYRTSKQQQQQSDWQNAAQEDDLIDLPNEEASSSAVVFNWKFTGVVASQDMSRGNGYYVYTNQLEKEVFLELKPGERIELATWINFNLVPNSRRGLQVSGFEVTRALCHTRPERNTIYMRVRATIGGEADFDRRIATSYVPKIYDIKGMVERDLRFYRGRTLLLEVHRRRDKRSPLNWQLEKVVEILREK